MDDLFANQPVLLLLASTLCIGVVAMLAQSLPLFPGRTAFVGLLLSAAIWTAGVAVEYLEISIPGKMRVAELTWIGILLTPGFWALFSWQYVRGDIQQPVPRLWLLGQGLMLVLTLAIGLTNDSHHLLYRGASPIGHQLGAPLIYTHGPWFYVLVTYIYGMMIASLLLVINGIRRSSGHYRRQYIGLSLAALLPWIANFGFLTGWFAPAGLDTAPISFLFMGAIFYLLIRRRQLFNLVPMARSALIDALADPMLVLDPAGVITDINDAARALAVTEPSLLGRPLAELADFRPLRALLSGEPEEDVLLGLPPRRYHPMVMPLVVQERDVGLMVILRPVQKP
jgi:PAS domain-containing protein